MKKTKNVFFDGFKTWQENFEDVKKDIEERNNIRNRIRRDLQDCGMSSDEAHSMWNSSVQTLYIELLLIHQREALSQQIDELFEGGFKEGENDGTQS